MTTADSTSAKPSGIGPTRVLVLSLLARVDRGGQANIARLLEGLPHDRYRFWVVSVEDGPLLELARRSGHDGRILPVPRLHRASWLQGLRYWRMLLRWIALVREVRPQVVYIDPSEFVNAMAVVKRHVPFHLLWHAQTAFPVDDDAEVVKNADTIVVVSRAVEERLRGHGFSVKQRRIPNAVDTVAFSPTSDRALRASSGVADEDVVFVYVGSLESAKGSVELLRAFRGALASIPTAKLWLVGDGDAETSELMKRLVSELSLEPSVRFWGSQRSTRSFYAAADVFVFPSHAEGLPLALLEAMAMGLPCIATDIPGNRDALDTTGRLVPKQDDTALAEAMVELARDPAARRDLGRQARARAKDQFDLKGYVAAFDALFEELAS